jgi:hypothetical protein
MRSSDLDLPSYDTLTTLEIQDLVETIDTFTTSADFLHWITDGNFTEKLIHEHSSSGQHSRIYQCYENNNLLFTGKFNIFLNKMNDLLFKEISKNFSVKNCSKKKLVQTVVEPYYNVISHCIEGEEIFGMSWEIYELAPLTRLYQKKNDPLRYWKLSRRE